jgi:hypothetical protein
MLYWLFIFITAPALAGCGYFLVQRFTQRERALREVGAESAHRGELPHKLRPTDYYIKIALKDPLSVARRESMLGRFGSVLAPVLITKEVYRQLEVAIRQQLDERQIEAQFSIHIARSPLEEGDAAEGIEPDGADDLPLQEMEVERPGGSKKKRSFNPFRFLSKRSLFKRKRGAPLFADVAPYTNRNDESTPAEQSPPQTGKKPSTDK